MLSNKEGYSLLEMMIVILISSTLLGSGLFLYGKKIERDKFIETRQKVDYVVDAVNRYIRAKGHLPCVTNGNNQDIDSVFFGKEAYNVATKDCIDWYDANLGGVPFIDLEIGPEYSFDSWGNRLEYAIGREECVRHKDSTDPDRYNEFNYFGSPNCYYFQFNVLKNWDDTHTGYLLDHSVPFYVMSFGPTGIGALKNYPGADPMPFKVNTTGDLAKKGIFSENEISNSGIGHDDVLDFFKIYRLDRIVDRPISLEIDPAVTADGGNYFDDIVGYRSLNEIFKKNNFERYTFTTGIYGKENIECQIAGGIYNNGSAAICSATNTDCNTVLTGFAQKLYRKICL